MRQMKIDKLIVLDHEFDQLIETLCQEKLVTTACSNGIECSGIIKITGKGKVQDHIIPIDEAIDVSIFAPSHKLSNDEQFYVSLSEYDIQLKKNELHCCFTFDVSGVVENQMDENESASLEDLLDDSEVVSQKVRYALTYNNDSYTSIAARYRIDERTLRKLNHNKSLSGRMLILLP
ncbi:MAG: hypothetical protein J6K75_00515 [Erysipelotrichaceae bacterium]|nr:hypothetical protein [Erysipelotrichaceae bacterium]MBQ7888144.1 hypothetical protein [Erysipelotrichaceae bacterium]